MYLAERSLLFMRGFVKRYGPSNMKKKLWDQEFSTGHWNFIDNTAGDCVYPFLEKYVAGGSLLDLGCGPGNTANELAENSYRTYVGVDISEAALVKARKRTDACGRSAKNTFEQGDFLTYVPPQEFDVILFRESVYHIPLGKMKTIMDRFSEYLADDGVFVVRLRVDTDKNGKSKSRPKATVELLEQEYDIIEKGQFGTPVATIMVFRMKSKRKD